VAEKFLTGSGAEFTPELRLAYSHEVLADKGLFTVAAIDGTRFVARGVKPSRDMVTAGVGLTLRAADNIFVYANYDIFVYANYDAVLPTGNTSDQSVSAGLRLRF